MKIPGLSTDELRADSRAILSAIVRPQSGSFACNAVVFTQSALVCVQQLSRNGVVGSCSSPVRVTRDSEKAGRSVKAALRRSILVNADHGIHPPSRAAFEHTSGHETQ